jgi:hypothetical protein
MKLDLGSNRLCARAVARASVALGVVIGSKRPIAVVNGSASS